MKILNRAVNQSIASGGFATVVSWTADGTKKVLGFIGHGEWSGRWRLLINAVNMGEYITSPEDRTAYVIGEPSTPTNTHAVILQVYHEAGVNKNFTGYLLEG